ncbi:MULTISPECIES: DUF4129 domain-containing protein [Actinomadura]|uniref:DUF4129 domain-containing protein n=1 Tax=Actinomadura yumaensis TaxID=111807 RepID=A0ABW2D2F6_9ACTN|nr:DUF4129 domain-containing protein [Actinomadura sp. J1-007]MWK36171.1 DUF4129 domain-containing protein [Actinomadura sp. J1-007]
MTFADPIGRDEARELARRELDQPIYHRDDPSRLERTWDRFTGWMRDLFDHAAAPNAHGNGGGWISIAVIVVLAAAAVALVLWLMRGRRNVRSGKDALLEPEPSTALDHRRAAEEHAAAGRWPEAIRERLRAVARDLEERAVLAPRPGRTADELAAEAGAAVPQLADDLAAGVRIFDDVWYGDRPGSAEGYARLKELDERLQAARPKPLRSDDPVLAGAGTGAGTGAGPGAGAGPDGAAEDGGPRW